MSRNGSGTYNLPAGNPVVTGTTISSTWANNTLTDIATALTGSLAADGQTTATGNLKMGNNRITGLADGIAATDAPSLTQVTSAVAITGGTINGTTIGATTAATGKFTTLEATGVTTVQAGTAAVPAITTTGDTNTGIFFPAADTIAFTEGGVESMRINSSGNLVPGADSTYSLGASGSRWLTVNAGTFSEGGAANNFITTSGTSTLFNSGSTWQQAIFYTAGAEKVRIDSSGNLLVGTTSKVSNGLVSVLFNPSVSEGTAYRISSGTNATYLAFQNASSLQIGFISGNGSNITYSTSSDYRLKQDIAPMTGALAKVSALKPVTYKWKIDGSNGEGFIAHELAEVCPDAVVGTKDAVQTIDDVDSEGKVIGTKEVPKYQGIDTSFLVATLTAAIQELNDKVDAQASQIAALENPPVKS
jgi:hypothetical protein